jgi:[ribosomal protein S5]-alanine N-acetyltransferase
MDSTPLQRWTLDGRRAVWSNAFMVELRPVSMSDAAILYDAWGRYPENFERLTARAFRGIEDAAEYLRALFPTPQSLAFHIISDGRIVGIVKAAVVGHRAQVGYVVHQPHWGKGLATEAVRKLTELLEGSPGISRIWATCALDNPGSIRVLEKCGFQREAILRNWVIYPAVGSHAIDNYSYVKLPRSVDS